jgi:maleate isomerase
MISFDAVRPHYSAVRRIGVILPSQNTVAEREFTSVAPADATFHFARVALERGSDATILHAMAAAAPAAALLLRDARPERIVYACTSGSLVGGPGFDTTLAQAITDEAGIPATTTATEVVRALHAVGAQKVAVATPYLEWVTDAEADFFEAAGVPVASKASLGLVDGHDMAALRPEDVMDLARQVDCEQADVIFLSCTDLPTLDVVDRLEQELGKIVISSNLATLWGALGTSPELRQLGRLFQFQPAGIS